MKTKIFNDAHSLAVMSARRLRDALVRKPDTLFCFAAGRTQLQTYEVFAECVRKERLDTSKARVIGLDDIVGANTENREGFRYFLDKHLFSPAGFREENIHFFDTVATDPSAECARIDAWLDKNGPIEFLLLGVGLNGHIGYNEPGTPADSRSHIVETLTQESVGVSRQYFDHDFNLTRGITLGLRDLLMAKEILVQALGAEKRPAVEAIQSGKSDPTVPVTHLIGLDKAELFVDIAASGN